MPVILKLALYLALFIGGEWVILGVLKGPTGMFVLEFTLVMGLASIFVSCRNCGKSVFKHEVRRMVGLSVGSWRPWPEAVCSRCGRPNFRRRHES